MAGAGRSIAEEAPVDAGRSRSPGDSDQTEFADDEVIDGPAGFIGQSQREAEFAREDYEVRSVFATGIGEPTFAAGRQDALHEL